MPPLLLKIEENVKFHLHKVSFYVFESLNHKDKLTKIFQSTRPLWISITRPEHLSGHYNAIFQEKCKGFAESTWNLPIPDKHWSQSTYQYPPSHLFTFLNAGALIRENTVSVCSVEQLEPELHKIFPVLAAPLYMRSSYDIGQVMRKPVYAVYEQQRHRSASAFAQSDQHLCCSLLR